jgi:hypothetical protein
MGTAWTTGGVTVVAALLSFGRVIQRTMAAIEHASVVAMSAGR